MKKEKLTPLTTITLLSFLPFMFINHQLLVATKGISILAIFIVAIAATFLRFLGMKVSALFHPETFRMDRYDVSVISRRVYGTTTRNGFFAEVLRMSDRGAVNLEVSGGKLQAKKRVRPNMTRYQAVIYDNLDEGFEKTYTEWKRAVDADPQGKDRISPDSLKDATQATKKPAGLLLMFSALLAAILLPLSILIVAYGCFTTFTRHRNIKLPGTQKELEELPPAERRAIEGPFTAWYVALLILTLSAYFLVYFFKGPIAGMIFFLVFLSFFFWFAYYLEQKQARGSLTEEERLRSDVAGLFKSLKTYSELENQTNPAYFLMYGEYAAWALALRRQNPKIDARIDALLRA
jgi:hypothetical protein